MLLKRWRIGSLSAALCLIGFGVLMLAQIFGDGVSGELILSLWPVVMILLGLEVLAHLVFVRLEEGQKARYDVLGILFMGGVLFVSFIAYALNLYIGFFDSREAALSGLGIYTEQSIRSGETVFEGAEQLVLQNNISNVRIRAGSGEDIRVAWEMSVTGNSRELAEEAMDAMLRIEKGLTAYMDASMNAIWRSFLLNNGYVECVVYLPEGKLVDMSQYHGYFYYEDSLKAQIIRNQEEKALMSPEEDDNVPLPTSTPTFDMTQDENGLGE